ncbi:hypothetical protein AB0N73_11855 [Microbacterium sp. NPDC089189]|uniref:hypothetical protein n=1 Tax=Microbacterium sp. NPDC089189 TaxID=3154972 RepID=UPI00342B8153
MSETRTRAIRELLAQRIRDDPAIRRKRLRRRIAVWGSAGLVGAVALTTGAAILFGATPVTDKTIVHCLSSTIRDADGTYPGSSATIADGNGPGRVDDALALCAQMWKQGALNPSVDPTAPTQSPGMVPPLQVCVMRDGTAAVVPSSSASVCQSLGMASLEE